MKKLLATALVLVLMLSLAATAFAVGDGGSEEQPVTVIVDQSNVTTVYSVDIVWESLNFTYKLGAGTWDPNSHTVTGGSPQWDKTSAGITVTNHSNAAVSISAAFTSGTTASKNNVKATLANHTFSLDAGQLNQHATADNDRITVSVEGTPSVEGTFDIDNVKVTVSRS